MKRIISLSLTLLMIFALVGCGSKKREIVKLTLSTEDSEAILAAAGITLPPVEEAKGANTTVKWFYWHDHFHNYAEDEIINTGFWTFQEKYGGDVEWVETTWGTYDDDLANLILAGTSPDFSMSGGEIFPGRVLQGLYAPVDDYIDYDDPLWAGTKDFTYKYTSLNGKAYSITTDISFGDVCAYNRRVIDEWGFEDPATLYYNDEWTWDVFYEMCVEFTDPDEDRYALDGWRYGFAIMNSTGQEVVRYDTETCKFVANIDNPSLERAAQLLYDLDKNDAFYPKWDRGWKLRNDVAGGGIKEGLSLFSLAPAYTFIGPVDEMSNIWGDVTAGDVMFCPVPRDPNGDGKYYLDCAPVGFTLVKGGENFEAVALLAACDRFKVVDPTVISIDERQLREIYLWTDEMLAMYDICYNIGVNSDATIFSSDLGDKLDSARSKFYDHAAGGNASTWAQLKEDNGETLLYYTDKLNEQIAEME